MLKPLIDPPPTRFASHAGLARLPYFDLNGDGRLVLADPSFGPSIDVHTHLALAYLLPSRVDLQRSYPKTRLYLDVDDALDLKVYANRNFTQRALKRLTWDLTALSLTGGGMRATHTVPNLLRDMHDLGVVGSVLLPIDLPAISDNAGAYLRAVADRPNLLSLGSVHPISRGRAAKLDRQKALGARGVKVHPASQMIRPDHPRAMELYRLCGERDLPVLFHCGPVGIEPKAGRRRCQLPLYEPAVAENPQTTFVLGHSGALQMDQALDLALRYDNVYLEISSQGLTNVRRIVERGPEGRVMMGSDWPFYSQAMPLAKLLLATEGATERRRQVLYDNAARLFGLKAQQSAQ
jgi:predicted TIM-barrel fold metal-dependent hydrolase